MARAAILPVLAFALVGFAAAPAFAVPQCTVSGGATLSFGSVVALASTGDVTSDSGTSFWLNCNAEVTSAPAIYSPDARAMSSGASMLPFSLSLTSPSGLGLPMSSPGTPLSIAKNGTNQTVTLFGKIRAADFKSLPAGLYSTSITITVEY